MSDWLRAAAEVGGGVIAICVIVALIMVLGWVMERWSR